MSHPLLKNTLIGLAGGLAGTLAMRYYWQAVTKLRGQDPRQESREGEHALDDISLVGDHHQQGESATAALGRIVYESAEDEEPPEAIKEQLSQQIHWTYGALQGALLGAGPVREDHLLGAMTWGTGMWLLGSEIALPVLGLTEGPTTQPLDSHLYGLGAHLAYGAAAALVGKGLHAALRD